MAELRTIQKAEIRNFPGIYYLLALSDQYAVIPFPLRSLNLLNQEQDSYVLVIGPSGLFLLACHLICDRWQPERYTALAYDTERSADMLAHYLQRHLGGLPPIFQAVVTPEVGWPPRATEQVQLVPWSSLRAWIQDSPPLLEAAICRRLLQILRAELVYHRVLRYQILTEVERSPGQLHYLAIDTVENRPVLLKEVFLPAGANEESREALIRGALLARNLKHENIVQIENIIPVEDRIYIVSEWCEGAISLRQYLNNSDYPGSVPLTTAIQLIKDLCQALMAAHDQGIIHRNLCPENLLVTREHRLKVIHFDAAKKEGMHSLHSTALKKLTEENPYADPDFVLGTHQVDQRVDVYSVGVIFYELLTGKKPNHYDEQYWEAPSSLIPGLPQYMDRLISRAIKFDKQQRYSTIHAFYSALEAGSRELIGSRYELIGKEVKQTPNSLIFKARDTQTQGLVALKKLLKPPTTDLQTRLQELQAMLEPLQALKALEHRALVEVIDTLIEDDDGYVVMKWVEGRTLREHLNALPAQEGLLPETVRQIALQLVDVLHYIHQEGYIHGDIKPENVMISQDGQVTLLDFSPWRKQETTQLRKIPKTSRYMAPELLSGVQIPDEQTDIFSLGQMMYELLTHRFPYDYAQLLGQTQAMATPPPLVPLPPQVPEDLAQVVQRAVALQRNERYRSFENLQSDLENDCDVSSAGAEALTPRKQPAHEPEIPSLIWMAVALAGMLLLFYSLQTFSQWQGRHLIPILEEHSYD